MLTVLRVRSWTSYLQVGAKSFYIRLHKCLISCLDLSPGRTVLPNIAAHWVPAKPGVLRRCRSRPAVCYADVVQAGEVELDKRLPAGLPHLKVRLAGELDRPSQGWARAVVVTASAIIASDVYRNICFMGVVLCILRGWARVRSRTRPWCYSRPSSRCGRRRCCWGRRRCCCWGSSVRLQLQWRLQLQLVWDLPPGCRRFPSKLVV